MSKRERGSGSILAVALIAGTLCLLALLLPLQFALARGQSLAGAADAAALAAADVSSGAVAGFPCESAAVVARANGAELEACELDGLVATVRVTGTVLGFSVRAAATAGPPPDTSPVDPSSGVN
ncbi:hypothetical protein EYE40_14470 [Glaciihabitans arcticus]|uniref:Helicase n=1 Tax=Glaciihabitans arcticus TaxID=2668039 RepID=A0A4Q9GPC4_9MICO|nr:Rv3654c family TadE-like protein [Glaciihabitans arcticus]TBN55411.1 hypothetical protein EYE40_14470 [Glaciihabitans arcticus]